MAPGREAKSKQLIQVGFQQPLHALHWRNWMKSDTSQSIVEVVDCWKICLIAPLLVLNFKTRWTRVRWLRHARVFTKMQTTFKKTTASSKRSNSQVSNERNWNSYTYLMISLVKCVLPFGILLFSGCYWIYGLHHYFNWYLHLRQWNKEKVSFCFVWRVVQKSVKSLFASKAVDLSSEVKWRLYNFLNLNTVFRA